LQTVHSGIVFTIDSPPCVVKIKPLAIAALNIETFDRKFTQFGGPSPIP